MKRAVREAAESALRVRGLKAAFAGLCFNRVDLRHNVFDGIASEAGPDPRLPLLAPSHPRIRSITVDAELPRYSPTLSCEVA